MTYNVFSGTLNHTHLHLLTGLGQGDIVLDGDPAPPTEKDTAAPTFRPISIVAKLSPISATAELLSFWLRSTKLKMQLMVKFICHTDSTFMKIKVDVSAGNQKSENIIDEEYRPNVCICMRVCLIDFRFMLVLLFNDYSACDRAVSRSLASTCVKKPVDCR